MNESTIHDHLGVLFEHLYRVIALDPEALTQAAHAFAILIQEVFTSAEAVQNSIQPHDCRYYSAQSSADVFVADITEKLIAVYRQALMRATGQD